MNNQRHETTKRAVASAPAENLPMAEFILLEVARWFAKEPNGALRPHLYMLQEIADLIAFDVGFLLRKLIDEVESSDGYDRSRFWLEFADWVKQLPAERLAAILQRLDQLAVLSPVENGRQSNAA